MNKVLNTTAFVLNPVVKTAEALTGTKRCAGCLEAIDYRDYACDECSQTIAVEYMAFNNGKYPKFLRRKPLMAAEYRWLAAFVSAFLAYGVHMIVSRWSYVPADRVGEALIPLVAWALGAVVTGLWAVRGRV